MIKSKKILQAEKSKKKKPYQEKRKVAANAQKESGNGKKFYSRRVS